jgi:hypothetical protein
MVRVVTSTNEPGGMKRKALRMPSSRQRAARVAIDERPSLPAGMGARDLSRTYPGPAQFKTLKYRPGFPDRFGSAQHARAHCGPFFAWYNCEQRHGGIGLLTPHDVHYGLADERVAGRARVLASAYATHPERFPAGEPMPAPPPPAVWINPPTLTPPNIEEAH